MACGCITPPNDDVLALSAYIAELAPITWGTLNNVVNLGGSLYRSGGVTNTNDAYGLSANMVEGTGCALWECRQFFDDNETNNEIYMVLEDEFGNTPKWGWHFTNQTVEFRRAPRHDTTEDFPIYYGPAGGAAAPDQVGYNVGFRFGIYYFNGTVWLYENQQWTNDTDDFFGSGGSDKFSYVYAASLATDRRWRMRVFVFPAAVDAHSPLITEYIVPAADVCGEAAWPLPALQWSATASVSSLPTFEAPTMRFDAGVGSEWYLLAQLSDSGQELRTKVVKDPYIIGRTTNGHLRVYRFDVGQEIDVGAMENDERLQGASQSRPIPDKSHVTQSAMIKTNVTNASMHTIRISGDDRNQSVRNRIDQVTYQLAQQGVRR